MQKRAVLPVHSVSEFTHSFSFTPSSELYEWTNVGNSEWGYRGNFGYSPGDHTLDDCRNDFTVTRDLTDTREIKRDKEKQIEDSQRCQLALLARVLFYSEKQSIEKNMGDVLCFHGMIVAAKFQL